MTELLPLLGIRISHEEITHGTCPETLTFLGIIWRIAPLKPSDFEVTVVKDGDAWKIALNLKHPLQR